LHPLDLFALQQRRAEARRVDLFDTLPGELVRLILQKLGALAASSIVSLGLTCKRLRCARASRGCLQDSVERADAHVRRAVSEDPELWRALCVDTFRAPLHRDVSLDWKALYKFNRKAFFDAVIRPPAATAPSVLRISLLQPRARLAL